MVCQPGNNADGEIEADYRVHRQHERRRESGQKQVRRFIARPVASGTAPSHGKQSVDHLRIFVFSAVTQGRQVGNESDEPEQERDCEIGRDREHIPDERAAELWPVVHGVRIREHPISKPRPSGVGEREDTSASHREQRHRLRKAVDGVTP